jgi:Domain of unknown function (DUF4349)
MRSPDLIGPDRLEELLRGAAAEGEREARLQGLVRELRAELPAAPPSVRTHVRSLRQPAGKSRWITWRRAALVLVPAALAAAGALLIPQGDSVENRGAPPLREALTPPSAGLGITPSESSGDQRSALAVPPASGRIQEIDVSLEVRVPDRRRLEEANADATRIARELGGYVVTASFGTGTAEGSADLAVKVPASRVQDAVARFSELGTVTGQQIAIQDRQAELDARTARIQRLRRSLRITELKLRNPNLTPEQRLDLQLQRERQQGLLDELLRANRRVLRETRMADVNLALHTRPAPAKEEGGGKIGDAVGAALDLLTVAGAALIFLAIVLAPLLALGLLVWLVLRAGRRRRDERLLEAPRPHAPPS